MKRVGQFGVVWVRVVFGWLVLFWVLGTLMRFNSRKGGGLFVGCEKKQVDDEVKVEDDEEDEKRALLLMNRVNVTTRQVNYFYKAVESNRLKSVITGGGGGGGVGKVNCSLGGEKKDEVECNVGNKCIRRHQICDGFADCPNKSDEMNCEWCNRTFSNEFSSRFLIQNPPLIAKTLNSHSTYTCYYKIVNVKKNFITGVRLRKFTVGKFNNRTRKCEFSWFQIYESDFDEFADQSTSRPLNINKPTKNKITNREISEKVSFDERNISSTKYALQTSGRFCGSLHNIRTSFYATKKYIYVRYFTVSLTNVSYHQLAPLNDSFEFEVGFYDKQTVTSNSLYINKPSQTAASLPSQQQKSVDSSGSGGGGAIGGGKLNYGVQVGPDLCSRVFDGCSSTRPTRNNRHANETVCVISSPGYPGVYLKNAKCLYTVRSGSFSAANLGEDRNNNNAHKSFRNSDNEKLILVNDNMQIDANLCFFEPTNRSPSFMPGQVASTFYCDSGPRISNERHSCSDYINILLSSSSSPTPTTTNSNKQSLIILKHLCGMGRLPKIVTRKTSALSIEFTSSSDGLFANAGFLFYALTPSVYFSAEKYAILNSNSAFHRSLKADEIEAMKRVERWQVDQCDSDANECTIVVTDEEEAAAVVAAKEVAQEGTFRVGHLFGMNQYQPNGFTLKYVLKTKYFNTIAIFLEKYNPSPSAGIPTTFSSSNSDPCLSNYLTIETLSRSSASNSPFGDYIYYDDSSSDEYQSVVGLAKNNNLTNPSPKNNARFGIAKSSSNYMPNSQQKLPLLKLCDNADYNKSTTKYFLVKSMNSRTGSSSNNKARTDLTVSYFNLHATLSESARLMDFKLSYEFIDFDWHAYQEGSLCDFVYNANAMGETGGVLSSPNSRIFFSKTTSSSSTAEDETDRAGDFLKCKYRIMAKQNQYIRLTVKSVNFELDNNQNCENLFFNYANKNSLRAQSEKCSKLSKRLLVKDLQHSWADSTTFSYDDLNDNSDETTDDDDLTTATEYQNDDDDNESEKIEKKSRGFETKMCLCRVQRGQSLVYISKFDAIEIEYKIKLTDRDPTNKNDFTIKYEFIDRNCSQLMKKNIKSNQKGKIVYRPSANAPMHGVQTELLRFTNKSKSEMTYYEHMLAYLSPDERYKRELDNLNFILYDNLNFACKFYVNAPLNSYVQAQFGELILPRNCLLNHVKLYSNFTRTNATLDSWAGQRSSPFLKLCSTMSENSEEKRPHQLHQPQQQNVIVAQFFDESIANSSFTCIDPKNKICFLTSEIKHDLNWLTRGVENKPSTNAPITTTYVDYFYNSLVIEVVSNRVLHVGFDIKYNFFKIEYDISLSPSSASSSSSSSISNLTTISKQKLVFSKRNCDFKCFTGANEQQQPFAASTVTSAQSALFNDSSSQTTTLTMSSPRRAATSMRVCIDESLVCDGEIHCMFNNFDEMNCPIKLNSKTILIVLCSSFVFTLTVLVIFYVFRKYARYLLDSKASAMFKNSKSDGIRYSKASQVEN